MLWTAIQSGIRIQLLTKRAPSRNWKPFLLCTSDTGLGACVWRADCAPLSRRAAAADRCQLRRRRRSRRSKVLESKEQNYGYNALTGVFENLVKAGVIGPTKVTGTVLQNAASNAVCPAKRVVSWTCKMPLFRGICATMRNQGRSKPSQRSLLMIFEANHGSARFLASEWLNRCWLGSLQGGPGPANAPSAGEWRTFEVVTHVELLKPAGISHIWLPAPLICDTPFQNTISTRFAANGGTANLSEDKQSALGIVSAIYAANAKPTLNLTSRVALKNYTVDLSSRATAPPASRE